MTESELFFFEFFVEFFADFCQNKNVRKEGAPKKRKTSLNNVFYQIWDANGNMVIAKIVENVVFFLKWQILPVHDRVRQK